MTPMHLFFDAEGEVDEKLVHHWWDWMTATHRIVLVEEGDDTYGC